jgi:uncharacterized tellurite resistance protein B-like protein
MSFSDFVTQDGRKVARQHYLNLIEVFNLDGKITQEELALLHKEGKKFGLTDPEIDSLIKKESHHQYHSPYSLEDKFDQLYNVTEMILADDEVSPDEYKLLRRFAIEVGFDDRAIEILKVVLIEGVRNREDEETLLKKFRKELLRK